MGDLWRQEISLAHGSGGWKCKDIKTISGKSATTPSSHEGKVERQFSTACGWALL
jgi:hypothetical protein